MPKQGSVQGPKSQKVAVRDFGRKLWLLCLIHKAILAERQNPQVTPILDENLMPQAVLNWFRDDLFENLPGKVRISTRSDVETGLHSLEQSEDYPDFPFISAENLPIRHSVLNRRLALNLTRNGYASAPGNKNLKPHVARFFGYDGDHEVPVHVLYRCVRGFLMVPEGVRSNGEREQEDPETQFAVASAFLPEDFGLTSTWTPDERRHRDNNEQQAFELRQTRCLNVYLAFCGHRRVASDGTNCYGRDFETFRKAALAYYCEGESELCRPDVAIGLFPEAKRGAAGQTQLLGKGTALCVGAGHTDFGQSSLSLKMELPEGRLSVRGALDLDGRDDALAIKQLRVELSSPERREGVELSSFVDVDPEELPKGVAYNPGQIVVLDMRCPDTDALRRAYGTWMPALEAENVTRPFQMDFEVTAPLSGMDLIAESEESMHANQNKSAKEVLKRYLQDFIPLEQKDWEALRKVPIIRQGVFSVDSKVVRSVKK